MNENLTPQTHTENEQHLKALMERITNFAIYRLVHDNSQSHLLKVVFVSPSITEIMGVSDPMKFETWFKDIHPDDGAEVVEANTRAFDTGEFNETFRISHPEKQEERWIQVTASSIGDMNGQPMQVMGLILDVTEQKRTEEALIESNERFKSICETSPDLIFQLDLDGNIFYFSNLLESMFGYSFEGVKGKSFWEFISPRTLQSSLDAFEGLLNEKSVKSLELEIRNKDGELLLCEISVGPLVVKGNLVGLQGIIRDVTARKKAEDLLEQYKRHLEITVATRTKELRESESRYRKIVEEMPEMVCRFLPDGTITFANRACGRHVGGKPDKLIGNHFFQWISSEEEADSLEKDFKASIEAPSPLISPQRMVLADGSIRWIQWSYSLLRHSNGSLNEYQAVGRDISEERIAGEETKKLEKWRRRSQKLEAIGTLSAGIAHDFNNIMAVILGNAQLAMDDISEGSRTRNNLDEIYDSCLRARDMVKQILTFSREGDQELTPLSLTPVVKESIQFLRSTIPSTIEIRTDIQDPDVVNADPTQIGQIIMNLGANAAHAMGAEPGVLDISLQNRTIGHNHKDRYRVSDEGEYVKLKVRDTGCGMSPEVMSRIFNPYFTTKKEGDGTGMGLAVVHGIVENHDGAVWVDSKPGKGSTFHMLFPAVEADGFEVEIDHPQPVLKGTERILVVDDEKALLETEIAMLERLGYKVTGTTSPMEALKTFRKQPDHFDLIYTDMTMPGMTGLTLAKKLMEIRPHVPVILYSGHRFLANSNELVKSGIKSFLTKPVALEDIAVTIREVLKDAERRQS